MVEFGDELIMESYKIPWLIWIQLLVMVLLVILLFFGFAVFDLDTAAATSTSAASSSADGTAPPTPLTNPTSSNLITKVEDRRGGRDVGSSAAGSSSREEDRNAQESSLKDSVSLSIFQHPNHPCNYFGLAKRAILKCLGLDSTSETSNNGQHDKQEYLVSGLLRLRR